MKRSRLVSRFSFVIAASVLSLAASVLPLAAGVLPLAASVLPLAAGVLPLAAGCGTAAEGGMTGPTLSGRVNHDEPPPPAIQSNDVLEREPVTSKAKVKHILIAWRDLEETLGERLDERAKKRTRRQADALARTLLARVRGGEPIEPLMAEFSEDRGSAQTGEAYEVTRDARLVFEFKRLALRLHVGEAGLVLSEYGWHVMKRVE